MLSPPRLPASWVGFNAPAFKGIRRISAGRTCHSKINTVHANSCDVMYKVMLLEEEPVAVPELLENDRQTAFRIQYIHVKF